MNDITAKFGTTYTPVKAFVIYEENTPQQNYYVESYDMDDSGCPVNAHPLSIREATAFAKSLDTSDELRRNFLKPSGLLPKNVLYINPAQDGYAVWHTPVQQVQLYFTDNLQIPNGIASIPPLIWRAGKGSLFIYALDNTSEIEATTPLCHAPFFNLHSNGKVCMGTVKINILADCGLEEFMAAWQDYFFKSFFSHSIGGNSPIKGNLMQLWQGLVGTKKQFPIKSLIKNGYTLKHLLK